ncbi:hypothetical protein Ddye_025594 [Dipteronia dyeriana]|uniref:Myb-like domain-containing protein n=1 Tax=Dipteronia dyeriana TaxID=168575 RepID=A0AAD9WND8_9ROSI|nr:hypothetical protein Ddye_025582 [Dipteronia dyeriana]KAK2637799.1 hypothetical protein Ddye_025594 [Dipteronia dyeriana]
MFDGVPEQLHQFIGSSRTTTTLPLPSLSFSSPTSLHHHHHGSSSNPTTNNNTVFPNFDPLFITGTNISSPQVQVQLLRPLHQVQVQQQPNSFLLHPFTHNQQSQPQKSSEDHQKHQESDRLVVVSNMSNNLDSNSPSSSAAANWSNDEVLALLRIRSSLDNWFPEYTWAHVSRKLEEVGYKRSAEKCKEKFEEEESRYLSNINYNKISSHCRLFNEFEDFYSNISHGQNPHDHHHHHHENIKKLEIKPTEEQEQEQEQQDKNLLVVDGLKLDSNKKDQKATEIKKKRKRVQQKKKEEEEEEEFEMLKGFCEDIVKKMMVQQEEMHEKLVEDMVKRDEEKFAREEAWKKVEMDKINKQLEIRAHEQAIVSDRQATLIKFLKSFNTTPTTSSTSLSTGTSKSTTSNNSDHHHHHQNRRSEESPVDKVPIIAQNNPNEHQVQNPSSNLDDDHHQQNPKPPTSQNPNSDPTQMIKKSPLSPVPTITTTTSAVVVSTQTTALILSNDHRHDTGKRWPRDEVLALISMRCSLHNNNNGDQQDKEGQANKIPLWERISQGMSQLGYKRNSKRCKEKWENINKYFRKTKDNVNKKRSLDSRTCPYFHQLSTLYNQGTLVVPPSSNEGTAGNIPTALPENLPAGSNSQAGSSSSDSTTIHVGGHHDDQAQGEKISVQVPTFDFEF